jgi:predicted nucleotidyltransferase
MEKHSIELIVSTLNDHQAKYLIVGGLAVVAHGYVRFTADLDLILSMDTQNLLASVAALSSLKYRPRAPVPFEQFIEPDNRLRWIKEKGLTVFSLYSPDHAVTEIDLFVDPPLIFDQAYSKAIRMEIAPGIEASFCSIEDLIDLKTKAGRPQDLDDIAHLNSLRKDRT